MTDEMTQDNVQESQETTAKTVTEDPSNSNTVRDMMKYKTQRNEAREELAKRDADNEKRRTKKLEDEGKHKELIAEQSSTIDSLNAKLESQTTIVSTYKQTLVNGLTSDDERKEYLSTKSVDFLEELTKEKAAMTPPAVANPQESLGSVRKVASTKNYASMNEAERQQWHEDQTAHLRK